MEASITLKKVGKLIDSKTIVAGLTFGIERGSLVAIIGANDALKDKPSREPVDLALRGSGLEAGPAVWFVGDSDIDIECAINAQCTSVLLASQYDTSKANSNLTANFTFSGCMALSKFIDKM